MTTEKIDAVLNFRVPRSVEEIRSFLGLVNYVSRFIEDVATKTFHLSEIVKAKKFHWLKEQEEAFNLLKVEITNRKVLGFYQ